MEELKPLHPLYCALRSALAETVGNSPRANKYSYNPNQWILNQLRINRTGMKKVRELLSNNGWASASALRVWLVKSTPEHDFGDCPVPLLTTVYEIYIGKVYEQDVNGLAITGNRLTEVCRYPKTSIHSYEFETQRVTDITDKFWSAYERYGVCAVYGFKESTHVWTYVTKNSKRCFRCGMWSTKCGTIHERRKDGNKRISSQHDAWIHQQTAQFTPLTTPKESQP